MVKELRIAGSLLSQFLKSRLEYRADFIISLVSSFIGAALGFVFISALFKAVPQIAGWKFEEVLFIYGFSIMVIAIYSMISMNLWFFGEKYIVEGNFDRILLRPLNPLMQVILESLRIEAIGDIALGAYVVYWAADALNLSFSLLSFAALLFFIIFAVLILIFFFSLVAALNFWVEDRVGLGAPLFNMIMLSRYPTTMYSKTLQIILTTIFPLTFIAFVPATYFLRGNLELAIFMPLIALVFYLLSKTMWLKGIKRYGSTGS